jgi:microcystin-dependent protein
MTGPLKTITGSASAPAISPNNNPDIGLYWTATGIAFAGSVAGVRFIGELIPYTLLTAPALTVFPYGQTLLRASYPDLWAAAQTDIAAGNTFYNNGNGTTTFGIGDLRGRVVAGKDNMGGSSANRLTPTYLGVDPAVLGAAGGGESQTLTTAQTPSHVHANTISDPGHTHVYTQYNLNPSGGPGAGSANPGFGNTNAAATVSNTTGITIINAAAGGGGAHNNIQPTLVCNYLLYAGA